MQDKAAPGFNKIPTQQTAQNLNRLLNSLPKRQKEVLHLKYYEELIFEEVAQVIHLNYQSVLNHIHRALTNLRRHPDLAKLLGRTAHFPATPKTSP